MKKDVEIAQEAKMLPITEVAKVLDIPSDELEQYGKYKAKLSYSYIKENMNREDGKLVLVTAINPTPAGEGKTTPNVGGSLAPCPGREKKISKGNKNETIRCCRQTCC